MSLNSFSRILQTAPIVSALRGRESRRACCSDTAIGRSLLLQVAQLVLADLDLVAVGEPVRLDPAPVDVGAVERAEVVDVEAVAAVDQQGVVAGDGDVVEEDAGAGESFTVAEERVSIGRSPDAGVFPSPLTHPLLLPRRDGFYIDDLGSLNGTYVNRRRIESHRLADGDEIQIGKYKLSYLERSVSYTHLTLPTIYSV